MKKKWLHWAREIQALSQAGLEYCSDDFDRERYLRLREISVEIMADHSGLPTETVAELFANETGYQTPKVDVRAVVGRKGKLLMVKERDGCWSLPGGWADIGLSVRENVCKELLEEAGIRAEPEKILAVYDREKHIEDAFPYSVYKIFVGCRFTGGEFRENIETSDSGFFGIGELPRISRTRTTETQIRRCFDYISGDWQETLFD